MSFPPLSFIFSGACRGRPILRVTMLIDDQGFRARRQDLQRLQEFNEVVLLVGQQGIECQPLRKSLSVVSLDSFPGRGELPVMHERPTLVVEAPELARDKCASPSRETLRSRRVLLIEGLEVVDGRG